MSVRDIIKAATPASRVVKLIVDPSLQDEWDEALSRLEQAAMPKPTDSLADAPSTDEVIEQMEDIRARAVGAEMEFHIRQMPWGERIELQADHPPRPGNTFDNLLGYNVETFVPALIRGSVWKLVSADGDTVTEITDDIWDSLLGRPEVLQTDEQPGEAAIPATLNFKAVDDLASACRTINERKTSVPPSARSWLGSQDSGASLAQPGPGESAPSDSEGGSQPTPRKSSTTKKATRSKAKSAATSPG